MNQDPAAFAGLDPGARILLAFSGGIDSSAAAFFCRKAGFEVLPVYLRLLSPDAGREDRVRAVAEKLGLGELRILDLQTEFREDVMRPCWEEFERGRTPNPCVLCNPLFKFGHLQKFAEEQGCAVMATGHYVRLTRREPPQIFRGADPAKDQSYFLYGLSDSQLLRACFPLGSFRKEEIRGLVRELGLPNASDPESQDICFAQGSVHTAELLRTLFGAEAKPGCFLGMDGRTLGRHAGYHVFTPGQRKGTGVALGKPAYVRSVDASTSSVVLTTDEADLMADSLHVHGVKLRNPPPPEEFRCEVQIRYRGKPAAATVRMTSSDTAKVRFDRPVRAVTPGQAAVFYDGLRQLGGGCIDP